MRRLRSALLLAALIPASAGAHGIWGHVHVTGWAVENMPDDELRSFLLDDPEVFNALLFGAAFTDTGYARDLPASRAYSEHTHWEPFIEDYIQWMAENDPPPWTTQESKKRVAFLMGCASHGLQDSIFDSLFLHQVEERDGAGQSETDPGTDGFLVLDDHIRFLPVEDIPMETVLELYQVLGEDVTREVIEGSVRLVTATYLNAEIGLPVAATLGEKHAPAMPWGRLHYLDPSVPGSLRAEIFPTMRYQQAIWARLHGELDPDAVAVFAFPEVPRRLRSGEAGIVDSWVTLIFGAGLRYEGELVELLDASGAPVPFTQANSRWGPGHTRLIRLQPDEDLEPGGWYTVRLRAGAELIDGRTTARDWDLPFQVACESPGAPCGPLGPVRVASIDGVPDLSAPDEPEGCGCETADGGLALWVGLLGWSRRRR